jgi:hypothetical protein
VSREHRKEKARRRIRESKGEPSVYAIWFPSARVLKVGFTEHANVAIFLASARNRARKRGWETADSSCIWKQPGDTRTEAWMQATLAFRWYPAFEQKQSRICEWFRVPDLGSDEVVAMLEAVYGLVPPDIRAPMQLPMF